MILTRREKAYAIIAGAAVGFLGLYYFVLDPYLIAPRQTANQEITTLTAEVKSNAGIFTNFEKAKNTFKALQADGLAPGAEEADTELEHAMTEWTAITGVAFVKHTQGQSKAIPNANDAYSERTIQFTGTGRAFSIEYLLNKIESSPYIRLNILDITSRQKEGVDDLTVNFTISTICQTDPKPKPQ